MNKIVKSSVVILAVVILGQACGEPDKPKNSPTNKTPKVNPKELDPVSLARSGGGAVQVLVHDHRKMLEYQGITLEPKPTLLIEGLKDGAKVDATDPITFRVTNYWIGKETPDPTHPEAFRQHIHVIIDDGAYKAIYVKDKPIALKDLTGAPLAPGKHTLTAFLARNYHLSLKNPEAGKFITFTIKGDHPTAKPVPKPGAVALIYSRPKGKYSVSKRETEAFLVDYYMVNVTRKEFEEKYIVQITVTPPDIEGLKWNLPRGRLKTWGPIVAPIPKPTRDGKPLEELPRGTYKVRLDLLKKNGDPVPGPYNVVERSFKVVD